MNFAPIDLAVALCIALYVVMWLLALLPDDDVIHPEED